MKSMTKFFSVFLCLVLVVSCAAKETPQKQSEGTTEPDLTKEQMAELKTAYFASGCFWCTEAVFERVKGVKEVVSGYAGGDKPNPTYKEVASGSTEYAESVRVRYDADVVSYRQLVKVFYGSHDPTQLNRQGPDVGKQYRSAIFYQNDEELAIAKEIKKKLEEAGKFEDLIVTKFTKYDQFYEAEDYHQGYYDEHPDDPYIVNVSKPKVEKFMKNFQSLLKEQYKDQVMDGKNERE